MGAMLFCNIGWMSRYEGLARKPDKIVGGGDWVTKNKMGHEVCNFLACDDGHVYGHVETIRGKKDRKIRIEAIGGGGDHVDGVDVIWTATDPDEGGRKVVGWYRDATVFRERKGFARPPSRQHARDGIGEYRVRALAENMRLLDLEHRTLIMGRGRGWMGHTPWWAPNNESVPEVRRFMRRTRELLDGLSGPGALKSEASSSGRNSSGAARDPYLRYVKEYEVQITPRHSRLQANFEQFVVGNGATEVSPNVASVDLRYRDANRGTILAEIKPCERANARYAIRTAIGQLLDYRQRAKEAAYLLIVLEVKPIKEDRLLATSNGFGVAYPAKAAFEILWPRAQTKVG